MRVFLFGGTGFVGSHLCRVLIDSGHSIRLLLHRRRSGSLPPGIEVVEGDVSKPETYAEKVAGCDVTINLIGIIREFPHRGITFEKLHVQATRQIVNAARQAGVRRHLQMSALGVRSDAVSDYHRSKFRAEQDVAGSGLEYTIFRPSIIFGPGDEFINKLAGIVRTVPVVPVIGDGKYRLQPVMVDDVARCFAVALEKSETIGKTYELCGQDRITYDELLRMVGRVIGRPQVKIVHSPISIIRAVVPLLQRLAFFPITMDQVVMLLEENICSGTWQETFQFSPVPLEKGIRTYLS